MRSVLVAPPVTGAALAHRSLNALAPDLPVALLPIRIETRFAEGAGSDPDLLVRIYPDQIQEDGHEPELTAAEREWGEHFWTARFRAAGNAERGAAAWEQLAGRVGAGRAAWVARTLRPLNLADRPTDEVDADTQPDPLPEFPATKTRSSEWSRASYARLLPERFAVVGYQGSRRLFALWTTERKEDPATGPSPEHDAVEVHGVPVDEGMRWMVDFDRAVDLGLGVRVQGVPGLGSGVDLLGVFGVRSGFDPLDEAAALSALLDGHRYTDGLSLPSPGAPTNNTDGRRAAFSARRRAETPDAWLAESPKDHLPPPASDGATLARALALEEELLLDLEGADDRNAEAASLMQALLWAGTGGYALEQLLDSVTSPDQRKALREHFLRFVRAAGPLPLLRTGAQPYGVLPVAPLETLAPAGASADLVTAVRVLAELRSVWESGAAGVPRVGASDPEQALLRVLGMEARTEAFAGRPLLGPAYVRDLLALLDPTARQNRERELQRFAAAVATLLNQRLGLPGTPRLASAVYSEASALLQAPVTQPQALSSDEALTDDYLTWLGKASVNDILVGKDAQGRPFGDERKPLLFHLARVAILSELAVAAGDALAASNPPGPPQLEPEYVLGPQSQTMLWRLRQPHPRGGPGTLGDAIWPKPLDGLPFTTRIKAYRQALEALARLPSERLDRLVRETIDAHAHRLDAWITSLATRRLSDVRASRPEGLQVGAYGWVEDLRPKRSPVALPARSARAQPDPAGYVHAPSVPHATTAAILRSGQLAHAATSSGRALGIDLSSSRVRDVDALLAGLRQGQSLAELLGYRLERALHDAAGVRLDPYVPALRELCPARAGRLLPTAQPVSAGSARGTVDGMALLRRHRSEGPAIPWGSSGLPAEGSGEQSAIAAGLAELAELADALSDAVLAESVHQAAQGNPLRSGGTLDALDRGEAPPPELEVAHPHRSGTAATHRVGMIRDGSGQDPLAGRAGWVAGRPRTMAEPVLSGLCAELLPAAARVRWQVRYDRTDGEADSFWQTFTLTDLELAPLDVVYAAVPGTAGAAELERRTTDAGRSAHPTFAGDVTLVVDRDPTWGADVWTLTELQRVAESIRALLIGARPLESRDLAPVGATPAESTAAADLHANRIVPLLNALTNAIDDLENAVASGTGEDLRDALLALSAFALPEAVPDSLDATALGEQAERALATAGERQGDAGDALSGFDANAPDALDRLQRAARAVLDRSFVLTPPVAPPSGLTFGNSTVLCRDDEAAPDRWLARLARVRPESARLTEALACAAAAAPMAERGAAGRLAVMQWPQPSGPQMEPWVGLDTGGAPPPAARTSLVFEGGREVDLTGPVSGLLVDEWVEVIPADRETTSVAFGYDAPGACAPQAVLLGVPPAQPAGWSAEAVEAIVLEARRLALLRLVDPDVVPEIGHLLPALFLATNAVADTVSTDMQEAIRP